MLPTNRRMLGRSSQRSFLCRFLLAALIVGTSGLSATNVARAEFVGASAATQVDPLEGGGFRYSYTITNTSTDVATEVSTAAAPSLLLWAMPFFDDVETSFINGEASIFAPEGWTWLFTSLTGGTADDELWPYVAADDPKNADYGAPGSAFDDPPYTLVFFADPFVSPIASILPGDSLGGFGYDSLFSGTAVPFIAGFDNIQLTIGDPIAPRTTGFPTAQDVPEPGSLILLVTGGLTIVFAAGIRRLRGRAVRIA